MNCLWGATFLTMAEPEPSPAPYATTSRTGLNFALTDLDFLQLPSRRLEDDAMGENTTRCTDECPRFLFGYGVKDGICDDGGFTEASCSDPDNCKVAESSFCPYGSDCEFVPCMHAV